MFNISPRRNKVATTVFDLAVPIPSQGSSYVSADRVLLHFLAL